ncbi:MAG TPA: globin [Dehalococcoidia bacterium]
MTIPIQPAAEPPRGHAPSVFEAAGGLPAFVALVDDFYDRVKADQLLAPMFPQDLTEAKSHLALFLAQFFGGPAEYSRRRGHPRLRMRHLPFTIGQRERDAWLSHMLAALDASGIPEPAASEMRRYFEDGSTFMMNA